MKLYNKKFFAESFFIRRAFWYLLYCHNNPPKAFLPIHCRAIRQHDWQPFAKEKLHPVVNNERRNVVVIENLPFYIPQYELNISQQSSIV